MHMRFLTTSAAVLTALSLFCAEAGAAGSPGSAADMLAGRYVTTKADTLIELAVQQDVGFVELAAANPGVDPWMPGEGREIRLPIYHLLPEAPNEGIVINIADQRLYFFPGKGAPVQTYPIGVGRDGFSIPLGRTKVTLKREKPTWVPPPSVRAEKPDIPESVPPGPDNPLGDYALNLGWPMIRIHGTNRPYGVGRRVSHGCIRLYPADIETLFRQVSVGTPVTVVDQPTKAGWVDGELYVEVHPSGQEADELEQERRFTPRPLPDFEERIARAAGDQRDRVNWEVVSRAWEQRLGVPVRVTGVTAVAATSEMTRPQAPPTVGGSERRTAEAESAAMPVRPTSSWREPPGSVSPGPGSGQSDGAPLDLQAPRRLPSVPASSSSMPRSGASPGSGVW